MRTCFAVGTSLSLMLLVGSVLAAESVKSGPQPGDFCMPFEPKNVTGPFAGQARCLV